MQKKIYFLITFTLNLFFENTYAQKLFSGYIVNTINQPLQFATIGFVRENLGTYSDRLGKFSIPMSNLKEDTIRISYVGYKTVLISTKLFIDNSTIKLEAVENILNEIFVESKLTKIVQSINDFDNCSLNFFFQSNDNVILIAQLFEAPKENMLVSELKICKTKGESNFRVHIYDFDTINLCPSKELIDSVIEINTIKRKEIINVETYKVVLPQKKFFIAIEWIKIPLNAFIKKLNFEGKSQIITFYKPGIGYKNIKGNEGSKKLWLQTFNGKWKLQNLNHNMNLLISVKLK